MIDSRTQTVQGRCVPPAHTFWCVQDGTGTTPNGTLCYCGAVTYHHGLDGVTRLEPVKHHA